MTKLRTEVLVLAAALVAISHLVSCAREGGGAAAAAAVCRPSSCGDIRNISYPFRLPGDPPGCGVPWYELKCEDNRTILDIPPIRYWVKAIWYEDRAIQVIDARAIAAGPSFLLSDTSMISTYTIDDDWRFAWKSETNFVKFINCSTPVADVPLVDAAPCIANASSSTTAAAAGAGAHLYWLYNSCYGNMSVTEDGLPQGCRVVGTWPTEYYTHTYMRNYGGCRVVTEDMGNNQRWPRCAEVRDALLQGFNLTWSSNIYCVVHSCPTHSDRCYNPWFKSFRCFSQLVAGFSLLMLGMLQYSITGEWGMTPLVQTTWTILRLLFRVFLVRTLIGYIALLAFLAYKLRRRFLGMDGDVEMFLAEYRSGMPTRYTYRQIKKMTGNFREKLGQGGFGSVFRGKQLTGRPVAIKILSKSDSNGQDFINEVATIGRIHHANVVRLVGFCAEGSKRALVYEFMPNGSLEKYIYEKEGTTSTCSTSIPLISWEKTLEIAVGIARGIEYLHRGCDVKILHFDIKPQNVLLDTNFNPKISDFGLAKSYPAEKNTVRVTAVRGTIGYMAPELFYGSGVSSKSDVYSFGMLLMEMAGRRTNYVHPDAGSSDFSIQGYLPSWIYNQLEQGNEIAVGGGATDEEKNIVIKLFIVALWCIQMKPIDRPSMGKVVEMLEGSSGGAQQLPMPAKPFLAATDLVNFEDIITAGSDSSSEVSPVPLPEV